MQETLVKRFSNLQRRKTPEGTHIRLKHRFSLTWNIKKLTFFKKNRNFSGKSVTVPKRSFTLDKRFLGPKHLSEWKRFPLTKWKLYWEKVAQCRKKIFSTIIEETHRFQRIKKFKKVPLCQKAQKEGPFGLLYHPFGCNKNKTDQRGNRYLAT